MHRNAKSIAVRPKVCSLLRQHANFSDAVRRASARSLHYKQAPIYLLNSLPQWRVPGVRGCAVEHEAENSESEWQWISAITIPQGSPIFQSSASAHHQVHFGKSIWSRSTAQGFANSGTRLLSAYFQIVIFSVIHLHVDDAGKRTGRVDVLTK